MKLRLQAEEALSGPTTPVTEVAAKMNELAPTIKGLAGFTATPEYVTKSRAAQERRENSVEEAPSLEDLMTVKEHRGSLDHATTKQVAAIANKIGGVDKLLRCLEALDALKA